MRICLATESPDPSGLGEQMLALAQLMAPHADISLVAPSATDLSRRARAEGIATRQLDDGVARWLRQRQFDVVHIHAGIGWEGHALARAARESGAKVVRTEHLPWLLTEPSDIGAYQDGLESVDRLIAVSASVADTHIDSSLVGKERITVVPNGITPRAPRRTRDAVRRELGIAPGVPLLLHVGRFAAQKNHALLLDALGHLDGALQLLLVGSGPDEVAVARRIAADGLGDRVRLLGRRDDVPDLMAAADLLLMPSRFEGLSLVLLEAMAARLPIVACRSPGIADALDDASAWLTDAAPDAFAGAIVDALAAPDERQVRAERAAARQAADFTATRMADDTIAAYQIDKERPRMTTTRLAFIGAGGIAHRHIGVLESMDDVEIVGFFDPDAARADEAAGRTGARSFADIDAMIAEARPDALFICVPPFAHGPAEEAALRHRLPFFVEKPVALTLAAAEDIAGRLDGLVTGVGFHWRWLDGVTRAEHALGGRKPRLMSGYWLDSTPPPRWWWRQDQSGGQFAEQVTHIVDMARRFGGRAVRVFGLAEHTARAGFDDLDVATSSTASIQFDSGAIANISATCLLGWNHRVGLHLFGDGIAIELTDRDVMIDTGHGRPVTGNDGDPVWHQDRAFIDAVQGKENRIACDYADAVETLRIIDAIGRSVESGSAVTLEGAR